MKRKRIEGYLFAEIIGNEKDIRHFTIAKRTYI